MVHHLPGATLYQDDALVALDEIEQVDAVVTSPPYADARPDVANVTPTEYVEWISPFLEALHGKLARGGGFMLNLGRRFADGVESDYIERVLLRAQEVGWQRIDTIIWAKINPRPIPPYLTNAHEVVYWLTNDKPASAYRGYPETRYPYPAETLLRYQRRWLNGTNVKGEEVAQESRKPHADGARPRSVYVSQIGKEKGIKHPSPMALDLARFLVCLASPPKVCAFCGPLAEAGVRGVRPDGEICEHSHTRWRPSVVLDPFAGSGTTGLAATLHGRAAILIERDETFVAEACDRLAQGVLA